MMKIKKYEDKEELAGYNDIFYDGKTRKVAYDPKARISINLFMIYKACEVLGIYMVIQGGAVLGFLREGDYLDGDDDVDIFCRESELMPKAEEVSRILTDRGFKTKITSDRIKAYRDGYKYEISGYKEGEGVYYKVKKGRIRGVLPKDLMDNCKLMLMRGEYLPVPADMVRYCEHCYKDWKTPMQGKRKTYMSDRYEKGAL